jgi:hypothetical protein
VLLAILATTAAASHWSDRIMRMGGQYLKVGGRDDIRPLSVPCPGSQIKAISNQQKTRKWCAWAQRKGLLSG